MKKLLLVLPLTLAISNIVNAATDDPFYAGARVGVSHISDMDKAVTDVTGFNNDNFAGGIFMGYQITPWFAVEGGYTHLGNAKLKDVHGSYEAQGGDLVGKFSYSLNNNIDLFLKAGSFYYDWNAIGAGVNNSDNGWAATAGVGAEYFINNNISTRVEYQYYNDVGGVDIHFGGVAFVYHWGAPAPVVIPEPVYIDQVTVEKIDPITLTVPFAFDSTAITTGDAKHLVPFEERLNAHPDNTIIIVGHTDSRGSEAYNMQLSKQRAEAVAKEIRAHLNVSADRVLSEGRGELDPIASNDTEAGRAANRRVDIIAPAIEVETVTQVLAE
ncbi:OmpA family protein [Photobacterium phosphoreum]|uniref:OmpA family protein n=1 Tax=Photobacterium phosphoreum TaxID=659 RepID=UPI000D171BAB|nr:OmpA family protein [Photobacterium phosphoreum]MCD9464103.1 hypothetical protein [Photobacterium phosphoreum]MCD9485067.1 OmpA family protein [Photobacterium phosphoreum]PSU57812.1 hypothetical protein CTM75_17515 [Photobacterium phosphoreum]